jgi:hypothetical protein
MANRTIDQTPPDASTARGRVSALVQGEQTDPPAEAEQGGALGKIDTAQPLEARSNGAPLVPADADADRLLISEAATLARLAEQDRFDDQANADRVHIGAAKDLLAEAIGQREGEAARQLVDPDLIQRLQGELAQWAAARGLNGHQGGGSS